MSDITEKEINCASFCPATAYQAASVCLPVSVSPYTEIGRVVIHCCGSPVLADTREDRCDCGTCTFTIRQNICVEIPIAFKAAVTSGKERVHCGGVSTEGCPPGCNNTGGDENC